MKTSKRCLGQALEVIGDRQNGIVAIRPPDAFPKEVWEELARKDRLKPAGRGFYELGPQA